MVFWESTVVFWLIQWIFLVVFTVLCLANIVVFWAKKVEICVNTVLVWAIQWYFGLISFILGQIQWYLGTQFLKTNNVVFCGKNRGILGKYSGVCVKYGGI